MLQMQPYECDEEWRACLHYQLQKVVQTFKCESARSMSTTSRMQGALCSRNIEKYLHSLLAGVAEAISAMHKVSHMTPAQA